MIQIDTREQRNAHITAYFDSVGIDYFRSKLYVGDYVDIDSPKMIIERKKDVLEFAANAGKNHDRFKRELERLDEIGGEMHILIEEPMSFEDLKKWKHKRSQMSGETLYKICCAWHEKHNIEFHFCRKAESGKIIELLTGGLCD